MGYRIVYSTGKRQYRKRSGIAAMTGLCFLVFLILVALFWPQGWMVLREKIWQEDLAVAALEEIAGQLRSGEGFLSSVREYFQRIVYAGA